MVTNQNKAISLLSIAAKAGRVVSGGFMTEETIREGTACLVVIAADASANTKKRFTDKCTYYHVPYRILSDKKSLGRMIGKQERTTVTVTDRGLAQQIINRLDSQKEMEV